MKTEFIENYRSPHLDPLVEEFYDPREELIRRCDNEPNPDARYERDVALLNALLDFCIPEQITDAADTMAGRRVISLAWVVNPGRFKGMSLTALAKLIGVAAPRLQAISAEVTRRFGVLNRGQGHGYNRGVERFKIQPDKTNPAALIPADALLALEPRLAHHYEIAEIHDRMRQLAAGMLTDGRRRQGRERARHAAEKGGQLEAA